MIISFVFSSRAAVVVVASQLPSHLRTHNNPQSFNQPDDDDDDDIVVGAMLYVVEQQDMIVAPVTR